MLILPQNSPESAHAAHDLQQRVATVRAAIAQAARAVGRSVDSVTLLAASKGHGEAVLRVAAQLGLRDFGENYAAEALPKIAALTGLGLTWHFIGRLQANKTREIATHFHWVHGIDRLKIAQRLAAQRRDFDGPLNVCVQVNIAGERSKGGVAPAQLEDLLHGVAALPRLKLRGLMCMLPLDMTDPAEQLAAFRQVDALRRGLDTLSMGMSADYAAAIAAGATIIRIGTALFGPRYADSPAAP
jgi:pyridoxal phosphate enzyme (YggS family)